MVKQRSTILDLYHRQKSSSVFPTKKAKTQEHDPSSVDKTETQRHTKTKTDLRINQNIQKREKSGKNQTKIEHGAISADNTRKPTQIQ